MSDIVTAREYLRVSRDPSGRLRSPDQQHDEHLTLAEQEGWALGKPYAEEGAVSASKYAKKARVGFDTMLEDVRRGRFRADVLVLWEPSRGSRRLSEWATFLELLEAHHIKVHITSHHRTYDLDNARDVRSLHEDGVDSEYESRRSSGRIRRDTRGRAYEGRPHGRLLYGYRREYRVTRSGVRELVAQVPDEETAPIVKEIFDRTAAGEGSQAIATSLTKRGVPVPRPDLRRDGSKVWRKTSVHQIARNPAYLGERHHKGKLAKADAWEPLTDRATFDRANATLSTPGRKSSTSNGLKHMMTGVMRCGKCGGPLRWSSGGVKNQPMYLCADRFCLGRNAAALEDYVIPRVVAMLAKKQVAVDDDDPDPALQQAQEEVDALRARLTAFTEAGADGRETEEGQITPATLARIEARLLPQIAAAQRRVDALRVPRLLALRKVNGPIEEVWDDLDIGTQRELIKAAAVVTVYPVGGGNRRFDPSKVTIEPR